MLSKNVIKKITRLAQKKYRQREGLFVAEGVKLISELLDSQFKLCQLFVEEQSAFAKALPLKSTQPFTEISLSDLSKITLLSTPQKALATFYMTEQTPVKREGLTLALDQVRDPGNLGTIIRLCDWFGIAHIVCATGTVDSYNPKVVQATMGSLARVQIVYTDLQTFLQNETRPIYGTFMEGENLYRQALPSDAVIVMGNEANGISKEIETLIDQQLTIPRYGKSKETESLNVAMATSICLSEFRRTSSNKS